MLTGRAILEQLAAAARGLSPYEAADLAARAILQDIQQARQQPALPLAADDATARQRERQRQAHSRAAQLRAYFAAARKTHCKNGHPWTPESTRTCKSGGYRICRTCSRESAKRSQARQRQATTPGDHPL